MFLVTWRLRSHWRKRAQKKLQKSTLNLHVSSTWDFIHQKDTIRKISTIPRISLSQNLKEKTFFFSFCCCDYFLFIRVNSYQVLAKKMRRKNLVTRSFCWEKKLEDRRGQDHSIKRLELAATCWGSARRRRIKRFVGTFSEPLEFVDFSLRRDGGLK